MSEWWSWALGLIGVAGFLLAGKKVWWAWYVNIGAQFLWATYAVVTDQLGFLISSAVYFWVFTKNAAAWTREHREERDRSRNMV